MAWRGSGVRIPIAPPAGSGCLIRLDAARKIDLNTITVTERKASLLIDAARAFLQWGRHEQAYLALRAAYNVAHQEVAGRPAVRRLVRDLATSSPPSLRRHATQSASQAGVPL